MRMTAFVLGSLVLVAAATAGEDVPKPLTPAEAAKKVNEKVTLEMRVKSTGGTANWFLNSEEDYKAEKNFTVFIPKEAVEKFKAAKVDDPKTHFKGKTVRVTGTVELYREKPQIKVEDAAQIKTIETLEKDKPEKK
jgi:DNA/RNA endonuclease YhcR with UshA esterase domain